jgi:hypothetical protein
MIIFAIDGVTCGHSCSATCSRSAGWVPFHFGTKTRSINGATEEYLQTAGQNRVRRCLYHFDRWRCRYRSLSSYRSGGVVGFSCTVKWMWQHS